MRAEEGEAGNEANHSLFASMAHTRNKSPSPSSPSPSVMPRSPELLVSRHLVGSGHDWGGLVTEITNSAPRSVEVLYLEMVPWFFRLYLHTLSVSEGEREI